MSIRSNINSAISTLAISAGALSKFTGMADYLKDKKVFENLSTEIDKTIEEGTKKGLDDVKLRRLSSQVEEAYSTGEKIYAQKPNEKLGKKLETLSMQKDYLKLDPEYAKTGIKYPDAEFAWDVAEKEYGGARPHYEAMKKAQEELKAQRFSRTLKINGMSYNLSNGVQVQQPRVTKEEKTNE